MDRGPYLEDFGAYQNQKSILHVQVRADGGRRKDKARRWYRPDSGPPAFVKTITAGERQK